MKALKKVVRGVTLAELWATALTFVIMVVCYFISVVNRNFIKVWRAVGAVHEARMTVPSHPTNHPTNQPDSLCRTRRNPNEPSHA